MSPDVHDKMIITNIIVDFYHISCMDTKNMECDHFLEWLTHGTHALRILRVQKRLLRVHKDSNVQERGFYVVLGSKREDEHE